MKTLLFVILQSISICCFAQCVTTVQPGGGKLITCPTSVSSSAAGQQVLQMNPTPVRVAPDVLTTHIVVSPQQAPSINYGGGVTSDRYDQVRPGFYQDRSSGHYYSRSSDTNRRR